MEYFEAPDSRKGPGFLMRSYLPGDGPKLCRAVNASYEHLKATMDWVQPDRTEEEVEVTVRQMRERWVAAEDFVIGVWAPDESEVWGGCGFHLREGVLSVRNAEMGMWIHADQAGKGLGTRVLVELLDWGFSEWPWLRLSWRCDPNNVASVRVAEKAGLAYEGTLRSHMLTPQGKRRDTACYASLRSDWAQARLA